jgi:tight adherence protein B
MQMAVEHRPIEAFRPAAWRAQARAATAALVMTLLLVPVGAIAVEDETPDELIIAEVDTSEHPTVRLTVDAPATGGVQEDATDAFAVAEAGAARAATTTALATEDLAVVIVIDTSGSMGVEPMAAARDAATGFVSAMPPAVEIAVMEFASGVVLVSELTTDRQVTTDAIDGLVAGGNTSLYDAVDTALDLLDEVEVTREAIVLLSDGEDTFSDTTLEDVVARLEATPVTLHAIEFLTAGAGEGTVTEDGEDQVAVGIAALEDLVAAAGDGSLVSADDADTLSAVYQGIAASLTNRFEVVYASEAFDQAEVVVTFQTNGTTLTGRRMVELPAAPVEEEPEPEPEPEPEEEQVAPPPPEPFEPTPWLEPWMLPVTAAVFVALLVGGLLYFYGWRLTSRLGGRR